MNETQRVLRGHDFLPPEGEIVKLGAGSEVRCGDKLVITHYFIGNANWWITEFGGEDESFMAFGYCDLGIGGAEWGYVSLEELETLRVAGVHLVERDLSWHPRIARECLPPEAWEWQDDPIYG